MFFLRLLAINLICTGTGDNLKESIDLKILLIFYWYFVIVVVGFFLYFVSLRHLKYQLNYINDIDSLVKGQGKNGVIIVIYMIEL